MSLPEPSLNVISLGLGVQSTALYYMSSMGILPRADYAIFSDTGREKQGTYEYLEFLQDWCKMYDGIPILVKSDKNLYRDLLNNTNLKGHRFASIPAYTQSENGEEGMLRRQCTYEYKIQVIDDTIRELYGLKKKQRRPVTGVWMGITTDEWDRMAQPDKTNAWRLNVYPFTGFGFDRNRYYKLPYGMPSSRINLYGWYHKIGLPIPPKSGCVFCPYRSDAEWLDIKQNSPQDFKSACEVDHAIRNSSQKGITHPVYLHQSLIPLDQVVFNPNNNTLFKGDCSGNCNV